MRESEREREKEREGGRERVRGREGGKEGGREGKREGGRGRERERSYLLRVSFMECSITILHLCIMPHQNCLVTLFDVVG